MSPGPVTSERALPRRVEPEWLDRLAPDDPLARRTRSDLKRLNRAMWTLSIMLAGLDRIAAREKPRTILDLGAGDATLMLRIAKQRKNRWPKVAVTLLDRQHHANALTLAGIRATGWEPNVLTTDIVEWLAMPTTSTWDVATANLFVHHFDDDAIALMFAGIASRCRAFFCCEPRRSRFALAGSRMVGLLGAGKVTRFDAVVSVRAGFRGDELSALWPRGDEWALSEYDAALFSHCFVAVRTRDAR